MFRQLLEIPQFVAFFEADASDILEQYCKDTYVHPQHLATWSPQAFFICSAVRLFHALGCQGPWLPRLPIPSLAKAFGC
jgi:hypothetical protein